MLHKSKRFVFIFLFLSVNIFSQGNILNYEIVKSYSKKDLQELWKKEGIPKMFAPISSAIDVYEIIYESTWIDGSSIKASGLYFLPTDHSKPHPILSYQHGTDVEKKRYVGKKAEHIIAQIFATDGYAVSMPDYFGLGKGEGFHPYSHSETEALACIDMLRAVKALNEALKIPTTDKLFLSGYSQGAHATMAMHKKIEEDVSNEFTVTASSPMSGPYDLYKSQEPIMFSECRHPFFLPYLLISYQRMYNFYDGPIEEVFAAPFGETIPTLFNGEFSDYYINKKLPKIPIDVIREDLVEEYKNNPEFIFSKLLRENSNYNWTPKAPIQLCYCKDDKIVLPASSILAYETMKKNGAKNIRLKQCGKKFDHIKCAGIAMVYSKMYLDSFIKGSTTGKKGPIVKRWILAMGKLFADKRVGE